MGSNRNWLYYCPSSTLLPHHPSYTSTQILHHISSNAFSTTSPTSDAAIPCYHAIRNRPYNRPYTQQITHNPIVPKKRKTSLPQGVRHAPPKTALHENTNPTSYSIHCCAEIAGKVLIRANRNNTPAIITKRSTVFPAFR